MISKNKANSNLFVGPKSLRAIPLNHPLTRDLLIQSTLDPTVRRIEYHSSLAVDDNIVPVDAIVLTRDDGRFAVDVVDARPQRDVDAEGLLLLAFERDCTALLQIATSDIRAEPLFSNAREVWRHRDVTVNYEDRMQVLDALYAEGPFALGDLDRLVSTRADAMAVVFALACECTVELDLRHDLGEHTIVRAGVGQARSMAFGS